MITKTEANATAQDFRNVIKETTDNAALSLANTALNDRIKKEAAAGKLSTGIWFCEAKGTFFCDAVKYQADNSSPNKEVCTDILDYDCLINYLIEHGFSVKTEKYSDKTRKLTIEWE